jgi:anti-anti-sigma regulatory factor
MAISVREAHGVYFLSGELDWEGGEDLGIALKRTSPDGLDEVVLDLAEVSFIDTMGARTLVLIARETPGGIVLRYPQDALMRVFELLQVDEAPGIRVEVD